MPALSVLIKPASGLCNLRCTYCFYTDVMAHREVANRGIMSEVIMAQLIDRVFEYADSAVSFAFQGGEPTLAGLSFFEAFTAYVSERNRDQIPVQYALQTNGTMIDEKWALFLAKHHFLVGLSMDGSAADHDLYRLDAQGVGSYKTVEATADLLNRYGIEFNVLCVVTEQVAQNGKEVYRHFRRKGFNFMQFIPCLDPFESMVVDESQPDEKRSPAVYALKSDSYGAFLCAIFDQWYADVMRGPWISIRYFDNLIQMMLGYPPESCDMAGRCSINAVIEADGSVYPCDFYVLDEWCMGNVAQDGFGDFAKTDRARQFVTRTLKPISECQSCPYRMLCRSGCTRHKEPIVDNQPGLNRFCSGYKMFFEHAMPRLEQIVRQIKMQNRR